MYLNNSIPGNSSVAGNTIIQPVMKSRRANLAECNLSTSHSAMAGTPKGETRNARTRNTIPPTVCPPMNRIMESSVSTMQPNSHTADATQNRNVTIAASRDSATITGAARILRMILAATSIKKSAWFVLLPILYRWGNRPTRMSSFHHLGTKCPEVIVFSVEIFLKHDMLLSGQKKRSKCYADERGARNI